jgi:oligoribonuclease
MTGLDIQTDRVIEIAAIATDAHLNELDDGKKIHLACAPASSQGLYIPDLGICLPVRTEKSVLDAMGEWCTRQHSEVRTLRICLFFAQFPGLTRSTQSGLVAQCLQAPHSLPEVDGLVYDYARKHFPDANAVLAGSSVHQDYRWIVWVSFLLLRVISLTGSPFLSTRGRICQSLQVISTIAS